jgi:hypothetical protein
MQSPVFVTLHIFFALRAAAKKSDGAIFFHAFLDDKGFEVCFSSQDGTEIKTIAANGVAGNGKCE